MKGKRMLQTILLNLQKGAVSRARWLKKKKIFYEMGDDVRYQIRTIPLYPELIKIGSNVNISSRVLFVTHDAMQMVYNCLPDTVHPLKEKAECIEVGNNVFIGANCTILGNVRIGDNVIVSANSLVNKDLESGGIYGGIPAKKIGDFHELWEKRKKGGYPTVDANQRIRPDEIDLAWKMFYDSRN